MQTLDGLLLIAGRREYPRLVIEAAKAAGVPRIEVIAFKHETDCSRVESSGSCTLDAVWFDERAAGLYSVEWDFKCDDGRANCTSASL